MIRSCSCARCSSHFDIGETCFFIHHCCCSIKVRYHLSSFSFILRKDNLNPRIYHLVRAEVGMWIILTVQFPLHPCGHSPAVIQFLMSRLLARSSPYSYLVSDSSHEPPGPSRMELASQKEVRVSCWNNISKSWYIGRALHVDPLAFYQKAFKSRLALATVIMRSEEFTPSSPNHSNAIRESRGFELSRLRMEAIVEAFTKTIVA